MFGKLFDSMYDGTLGTKGPWQALVTFQQMIVLCDRYGVLDMTAEALSRRTTIPLDIIEIGIHALEQPDLESRSPAEDGRRVVRLNADRSWGWRIVNYEHYRKMRSAEERREYQRKYWRDKRSPKARRKKGLAAPPASTATQQLNPDSTNSTNSSKQYAVSSKHSSSSSENGSEARTAREELLSKVPSPASWEAEMDSALQGMHGPVLTAEQVELACREYLATGHFENPNLRHFRAFLRKASEPIQQEVAVARAERVRQNGVVLDAHRVVADIRALISTMSDANGGKSRFIPKPAVEALGADIARAYDEVGGADRFLTASGDKLSFLIRDMAAALASANGSH